MKTIQITNKQKFIFEKGNITVNTMFNMGKIWLTKKEISDIYWIKKTDIKKELNNILLNSNLDLFDNVQKIFNNTTAKNETFYSLDVILLLWYNIKHYKETKFLIKTNNSIKEYTKYRQYKNNSKNNTPIIKKIFNYFSVV